MDMPLCRPEDEPGRCDESVAINCADGVTTRSLCELEGLACNVGSSGAECGAAEVDAGFPDAIASDAGVVDTGAAIEDAGIPEKMITTDEEEGEGCGCSSAAPSDRRASPLLLLLAI